MAKFIPVNLITGFLGSGKTTLLQRLLADPALADTAVLINEFGEVGLDHHLLERIDETMVLLQSGCLCCTIRGELSEAIKDLHSRRERGSVPNFRRLVIESDLAELVDQHRSVAERRIGEQALQQRGLARAQEARDQVDGREDRLSHPPLPVGPPGAR